MSGFYKVSEWVMYFTITNILWVLFNLPIFILLFYIIKTQNIADFAFFISVVFLLLPILFFPATTAIFACARDWVLSNDFNKIVKKFWMHYQKNLKQSYAGGFLLTLLWVILFIDIYFFIDVSIIITTIILISSVFLLVYTTIFFSTTVHYNVSFKQILINTLVITITNPTLFIISLGSNILSLYAFMYAPIFITLFFLGAIYAFVNFLVFYRVYLKMLSQKQQ